MANTQRAALIYDFDMTLSPMNMQEYVFLPQLGISASAFWAECRQHALDHHMDGVLTYMFKMRQKAIEVGRPLTRQSLSEQGAGIRFFPGVDSWFDRVNDYGRSIGLEVEHYIISSGLKEIILGSAIARHFTEVFASGFSYGEDGTALWPTAAVNYTNKTQYLFRVNKGILDVTNDSDLNNYTPEDRRHIPFRNMIYVGDGLTDVPSMKMTRSKGGCSIAVYDGGKTKLVDDMIRQSRIDFACLADYSAGSEMERIVMANLRRIKAVDDCMRIHQAHMDAAVEREGVFQR